MLRHSIWLGCEVVALLVPLPRSDRLPARSDRREPVHVTYTLHIRVDPVASRFSAEAKLGFSASRDGLGGPADTLAFLLHGELRVDSLRVGGVPARFIQDPRFYPFDYS